MRSSQAAFDLIVKEEVSSKATYEKKYQRPEWPGASSGPTVGIGYDLGQADKATIRADWYGRVPAAMLDVMVGCSGHNGTAGKTKTAQVRSSILIPWDTALAVHQERVVPRWEARVEKALPNTNKLSGDSFGALLSLAFNRGTSFGTAGERYREMRAIKAHMAAQKFAAIPAEFRSMKRIWPTLKGLRDRRDREAALFEKGLRSGAIAAPPTATTRRPTLKLKSKGEDVRELQRLLGIEADGKFGPQTKAAVIAFQTARKLTVDGVVGPQTWAALSK